MSRLSRSLITGGDLILEPGGRLSVVTRPLNSMSTQVVDVSWFDEGRAKRFILEQCIPAAQEVEDRWSEALARRRATPWTTLIVTSSVHASQAFQTACELLSISRGEQSIVIDEQSLRASLGAELQFGISSINEERGQFAIALPTPAEDPLLAAFGALAALDLDAEITVKRPDGQEEEARIRDQHALKNVLQLLGVSFPLPDSKSWSGLTTRYEPRSVQLIPWVTTLTF